MMQKPMISTMLDHVQPDLRLLFHRYSSIYWRETETPTFDPDNWKLQLMPSEIEMGTRHSHRSGRNVEVTMKLMHKEPSIKPAGAHIMGLIGPIFGSAIKLWMEACFLVLGLVKLSNSRLVKDWDI